MTESTPPQEGQQPLTQAQMEQLRRSLIEQMLNRAQIDPEWRQLLIEDPELAMREANFPERQRLEEEAEVRGQGGGGGGYYGPLFTPEQADEALWRGRRPTERSSECVYWSAAWRPTRKPYYPPLH